MTSPGGAKCARRVLVLYRIASPAFIGAPVFSHVPAYFARMVLIILMHPIRNNFISPAGPARSAGAAVLRALTFEAKRRASVRV